MHNLPQQSFLAQPELLARFIAAHELGHAHSLLTNFLQRGRSIQDNEIARRNEVGSLPFPYATPSYMLSLDRMKRSERNNLDKMHAKRLDKYKKEAKKQFGTSDITDLVNIQDSAYQDLPSEQYANNFAASIIKQ